MPNLVFDVKGATLLELPVVEVIDLQQAKLLVEAVKKWDFTLAEFSSEDGTKVIWKRSFWNRNKLISKTLPAIPW